VLQRVLACEFGKSRVWITYHLQIADLPEIVKEKLSTVDISYHVAINYIVPLNNAQKQILFVKQIVKQQLSNSQTKKLYEQFKKYDLVTLLEMYDELYVFG
ncbi:unnamed protein product, partial [marine sediment metagenome]